MLLPLGALIAFALFFLKVSGGGPQVGPPAFKLAFGLVPVAMIAMAIFGILKTMGSATAFENSPLEYSLGVVVDERIEVKGGGEDSSASTHYFATIETADGARNEYKIDRKIAAHVSPSDVGVAWIKGRVLVEFRRVS